MENRKKIHKDYICENDTENTKKKASPKLPCIGCDSIFNDRKTLMHHQATCWTVSVDMSNQRSFFGEHYKNRQNPGQNQADPQSQPP